MNQRVGYDSNYSLCYFFLLVVMGCSSCEVKLEHVHGLTCYCFSSQECTFTSLSRNPLCQHSIKFIIQGEVSEITTVYKGYYDVA